jgi:hypothetical protein
MSSYFSTKALEKEIIFSQIKSFIAFAIESRNDIQAKEKK